ncbi:TetR/AcrR family transcriptional regulator [Oceanobacillus arenosus]|uniref:TetR/AcrR family transcriptional regulator n=1 Tax=Oceanobacillus arenosus TaxID=1229153 RepID=UPI002482CD2A|nr:TetR/AcrR family transcriptional regulator [Oceanobacillus arenosus]
MEKARTQFIEKGFQQASMRNIAQQLGCSHGAIYYYFKNKAALFYAIVEDDFSKLNYLLDESIQGPKDNSTKRYHVFIRFIKFGLNHQSQYEIMFMIRNTEVDSLSQAAADLRYQKFAQAVQSLSEENLKVVDIQSAFLALHGFISHFIGYIDNFEDEKSAAKAHVNFIIRGLNK